MPPKCHKCGQNHYRDHVCAIADRTQPTEAQGDDVEELIKIGHCPYDIEVGEGESLPEPRCHANNDGECDWILCPQPLLAHQRKLLDELAVIAENEHLELAKLKIWGLGNAIRDGLHEIAEAIRERRPL